MDQRAPRFRSVGAVSRERGPLSSSCYLVKATRAAHGANIRVERIGCLGMSVTHHDHCRVGIRPNSSARLNSDGLSYSRCSHLRACLTPSIDRPFRSGATAVTCITRVPLRTLKISLVLPRGRDGPTEGTVDRRGSPC